MYHYHCYQKYYCYHSLVLIGFIFMYECCSTIHVLHEQRYRSWRTFIWFQLLSFSFSWASIHHIETDLLPGQWYRRWRACWAASSGIRQLAALQINQVIFGNSFSSLEEFWSRFCSQKFTTHRPHPSYSFCCSVTLLNLQSYRREIRNIKTLCNVSCSVLFVCCPVLLQKG